MRNARESRETSARPRCRDTRAIVIRLFTADQDRSTASGIILASGVVCGHLALARRLIASGTAARNSRRDLDCPANQPPLSESHLLIYVLEYLSNHNQAIQC